jgi:branched-chain amino acid transport system substrate-binding protein
MRKEVLATLMIVIFIVGLGTGYGIGVITVPSQVVEVPVGMTGTVEIGVMVPLSGGLSSYGEDCKTAWELGAEDVNAFLKTAGANWTIKLIFEDTASNAEVGLTKFESLIARGVKIVLGPMESFVISAIKERAQAEGVLIISPSATAVELAIPDDNIFRFCAIDNLQGPAIATAIYSAGITHMTSVYIANVWGEGLDKATSDKFVSLGGTVLDHIEFPATFEPGALAERIKSTVEEAVAGGVSKDKIGVFLVSYAEAVPIFYHASGYPVLSEVKWFGTDGTVMLSDLADLTGHPTETQFALDTKFTSTMYRIPETRKFDYVKEKIVAKLGRVPTIYAYDAYDSVWVVALALANVNEYNAMKVKEILPQVAGSYIGASGNIVLNENGDLAVADYTLWRPVKTDSTAEWKEVGVYYYATDSVEWKEGFKP